MALAAGAFLTASLAHADGMQPESSIVIVYEENGEGSMTVTNTDAAPALLVTTVKDIPEDASTVVVATPPVARLDPGQGQVVRFLYQGEPLQVQRLKRVIFEGIGQARRPDGTAVVGVSVRQNLPMLLHPKGLPRNQAPWTLLRWTRKDTQLTVVNDSPYVVRLAPQLTLLPSSTQVDLGRTYLLPGQTINVAVAGPAGDTTVEMRPASVYGFAVDRYRAPLK